MAPMSARRLGRGFAWWDDMRLCLLDLAQMTGGTLRLARMPPRDGELTGVRRIVLSPDVAGEGDVFWCLDGRPGDAELAFLRGALAVASTAPSIEPWPGRACLQSGNPELALADLIAALSGGCEVFSAPGLELKDLQLSAGQRSCISLPARSECRMTKIKCRLGS
jgi:hypothetical protein